jgi:acyl carrier protein
VEAEMSARGETRTRLKSLLVSSLNLEGTDPASIEDEAPLFGPEGLGLDSVDALELVVALEKAFGVKIDSHEIGKEAFASIAALADYVESRTANTGTGAERG